jgi:hypothetical protein
MVQILQSLPFKISAGLFLHIKYKSAFDKSKKLVEYREMPTERETKVLFVSPSLSFIGTRLSLQKPSTHCVAGCLHLKYALLFRERAKKSKKINRFK